jgi:outer membrane receptor protein involved in Fe transport
VISTFGKEISMKRFTTVGVLLALLLAGRFETFGQMSNGTIAGSIVDPSGAAVSGATVKATSLETNDSRTAVTSKVGSYRIESVPPGNYRVDVTAASFAKTSVTTVAVATSVVTSVNVTMTIGADTTTVEVSADVVAALKTDNGELSDTLTTVEINNLPISTLNPYQLALTLPGVTTVTGADFTNGTSFSVNGNRPRDNNFLIESVDNNDQGIHGQAFQPNNIEAVQEVTFLLDSFSAEFGRGGAVSNLVMKGGSNQFHGAGYERLLNSVLDGKDKGDIRFGAPKTKSRENLFGFRISGPIIPNRMFFFVSNQWDRFRATANLGILTLPTAAGFTTLQTYAGSPQVANLLSAYGSLRGNPDPTKYAQSTIALGKDPVTNVDRGTVAFAGMQRSLGRGSDSRELEATSDLIVSDKDKLRFRFIQAPQTIPYDTGNFGSQLPNFDTQQSGPTYNAGIVHTHIFSSSVLNELRLAYSRIGFTFDLRPETYANPLALSPGIGISGITGYGIPTSVPQGRFQNTYQLEDAFSWTRGSHSMKFGFDIEDQRLKDKIPFIYYGSIGYLKSSAFGTPLGVAPGTGSYTALGNFIDNVGGTAASANISYGNPVARAQVWVQNYYAQDSWKIAHNFSFDFGLRYEYDGAPFNFLPNPAFDPNNPAAVPGGLPQISNKKNFAPRAGFNYSADSKTVISGGVGLFYSHIFSNVIDNILGSSPNDAAKLITSSSSGRGTANWSNILSTITNKAPLIKDTSNVIPQKLLDPLTYEYNLRVQRELPGAFVLAAEYVGNRSEHEYATTEFNPTINNQLSSTRLFPTRGRIIRQDNTGDSNYNSAQFELQHKSRGGLTFRGVYTYSKLLDDGSEIFTPSGNANLSTYQEMPYPATRRREYGASAFDHRNRVVVSAVYQPPVWHAGEGYHWAGHIVNGFAFSGISTFQSGQPINVEIGFDWNGDGISNDRPILLNKNAPLTNWAIKGDDPIFGFGSPAGTLCDGPRWWSTGDDCQVVTAANTHWVTSFEGTTQNTVARNYLFADHQSNTDFTMERSFKILEHQDFMIRAEALDVFNHGHTNSYNANLITGVPFNGTDALGHVFSGTTTFGDSARTVSGSRELRIYARYQF